MKWMPGNSPAIHTPPQQGQILSARNADPKFTLTRVTRARSFSGASFHNSSDDSQAKHFGQAGIVKKITYNVKRTGFDDLKTSNIKIAVELKEKGSASIDPLHNV